MTVYYIDRYAGSDSNSGLSEAAAWQNPSKLGTLSAGTIQPGDTVLLRRGSAWSGASGFFTFILQGSDGSMVPIKVGTYGHAWAPRPKLAPGGASPQPGIITVDGTSRIDFEDIEVDGESQASLIGLSHNHTLGVNLASTVGDYIDAGTSEISVSIASAGLPAGSWGTLAAGAKADVYISVQQIGGDSSASPAIAGVWVEFRRAKMQVVPS